MLPTTWFYSFKEPDGLLSRWIEKLVQFKFKIKHEAGKKILHADCLPRVPQTGEKVKDCNQVNQVNTEDKNIWSIGLEKSLEQLIGHKKIAAELIVSKNWIESKKPPQRKNMAGTSRSLWKLWIDFRNLRKENDLIKRNKRSEQFNNLTHIIFQRSFLNKILPLLHEHCGQFSMAKTFDRVRERFYWPGMRKDVHDLLNSCEAC